MHLLAHIGHGGGGQPAERDAGQRTQDQQAGPIRREGRTIISTEEANSDITMTGLRPNTSDSELATSMAKARLWVVTDSDRLACGGIDAELRENTGMIGCTQ